MPQPPKDPEDLDKINYVIDSWVDACDAPWYIYIETLKPALLEAFIVLISFGWADVVRGRFRPKGLGRRTSKRKGRWAKRIPAFPEIGNTIGKHLPFAEQIEDFIHYSDGAKNLWRIDNAIQAGLYFWLVADVLEDFAFNWTSLLYKTYWCQQSHLGRFSYHNTTQPGKSRGVWHKWAAGVKDYEDSPPTWLFDGGSSGPNGCSVGVAIKCDPYLGFPPPTSFQTRIYRASDNKILFMSDLAESGVDGTLTNIIRGDIPPNTGFVVQTFHEPSWARIGFGIISAVESE